MHDRDKVLYSEAFQRLAQITQVTASESGYVFHNRLSHSLKVAQIGRRLTESLKRVVEGGFINGSAATMIGDLDEDAVEAGCLAHDLGHPPFGHIAEQELQALTRATTHGTRVSPGLPGLFEGNAQSFRIATDLEMTSGSPGFNFTRQTLDALLKYPWPYSARASGGGPSGKWGYYETDGDAFDWVRKFDPVPANARRPRSLEAEIMDWADDLTYAVHDVEDFYCAGLIPLQLLGSAQGNGGTLNRFKNVMTEVQDRQEDKLAFAPDELASTVESIIGYAHTVPVAAFDGSDAQRRQLHRFGSDLITEFLSAFTLENSTDGYVLLRIDDDARKKVEALKALVHAFVIQRPSMAESQHGQRHVIRQLFEHYLGAVEAVNADGRTLPYRYRLRLKRCKSSDDRMRLVVDLVSGLTEEEAYRVHRRLTGRSRMTALV